MQRHAYDFPYVVQTFESPLAQEAKSSRTARVAFGYSPLFGRTARVAFGYSPLFGCLC